MANTERARRIAVSWESLANDPLVSLKVASQVTGVPIPRLRRWCRSGFLFSTRIGRERRVRRSEILRVAGVLTEPVTETKQKSLAEAQRNG